MASPKILIIEDEAPVADDLRKTLESLGYVVSALAVSGEKAVPEVAACLPDLVLMHSGLPGAIDELVAVAVLLRSQFRIPVVFLATNADPATLDRVKSAQPFGYILKPFSETVLSTTIEIALVRHQAEAEIERSLVEAKIRQQLAEEQTQQKSEFLSLVAHELRNPLSTIKFATEALQTYGEPLPADSRQRYIDRIQSATENLTALIGEVLFLEQTSTHQLHSRPALIDVVDFCHEMADRAQFTSDRHTLHFSANETSCLLVLDEKLLWHVLNNLLSNAIKYSPAGGDIEVRVCCSDQTVRIQVEDWGIGIPESAIAHLFQPFQRGNNVGQIPGTGLGLAIAKQCIERQGGTIAVISEAGKGTTFTVTVPSPCLHGC